MQKIGFTSFQLKMIALILMTVDHLPLLLGREPFPYYHLVSGVSAALFAFVLTEGFFHTSSHSKYLIRLAAAAAVMSVGNRLITYITDAPAPLEYGMFASLAFGFAAMWVFQWARTKADVIEKKLIALAIAGIICILGMMYTDSGYAVIPVILIGYFFHERKGWICLFTIVVSAVIAFNSITYSASGNIQWDQFFGVDCQWSMVAVIFFILLYSGRPGAQGGAAKWFFYVYYPLHIWAFYLAGMLIL